MSFDRLIAAITTCVLTAHVGAAQSELPIEHEPPLMSVQHPAGLLFQSPPAVADVSEPGYPPSQAPLELLEQIYPAQPSSGMGFVDPYVTSVALQPAIGCCDVCGPDELCKCRANYRSGWTLSLDGSALQSHMATRDFDAWPDEFGAAGRITLGYEWASGLGIRTQAWGYSLVGTAFHHYYVFQFRPLHYFDFVDEDIGPGYVGPYGFGPVDATFSQELEVTSATVYVDFYTTISAGNGEFLLGGGPAFGNLDFSSPPRGDGSQYYGGGISVFGQGFYPFFRRWRWELALSGQARVSLLTGEWDVDFPSTATEHTESMSIFELGIGPEIRRRYGRSADRYWFLRTLAEFQQWRSDRMGPMGGDTLALYGATVSFGVNW